MNRNFFYLSAIGILLIIACTFLMSPASAYNRIPQGGIVYLNDTVDISGTIGWCSVDGCKLAYANDYTDVLAPENSTITFVLDLPQQKELYYNFTIDPAIFGNRLGWWYQNPGVYEPAGNLRAFQVWFARPPVNVTVNETVKKLEVLPPPPPIVQERHIADYLIARGDPFTVIYNTTPATSAWIFGRLTGIYDRRFDNQTVRFNASETQELEPGSYTLMLCFLGNNSRFDIRLTGDTIEYFDADAFKVREIETEGRTPTVVFDSIKQIPNLGKDQYKTYTLEIQNPSIEITEIETLTVSDLAGVLQVRGYTNLANNTPLTFVLDEKRTTARTIGSYTNMTAVRSVESPGSMRYFDVGIPILWSYMPPGEHDITAYGSFGTKMIVSFWIYEQSEDQPRHPQLIKYVGGYEFVPTPTPEIIVQEKVVTQIVTQLVTVPVTPSDEQVHIAQSKVWWESANTIAWWVFLALIIGGCGFYAVRLYYRRKDDN